LTNGGVRHQTPAGIFANAPFLRHLKKLGVRVVLFERNNGLAESISNSNTMRADKEVNKVHLQLQKLSKVRSCVNNTEWIRHRTHVPCLRACERAKTHRKSLLSRTCLEFSTAFWFTCCSVFTSCGSVF